MNIVGSEWRKWNFHVHTKGTNKNDQFSSATMDDFFYTFYKKAFDNQVSSIGITDYFSIERYLDALKYRENIELKLDLEKNKLFSDQEIEFIKNIFIFPNVELRISPATKKGKFINLHFLFNPDFVDSLPNNFFNKLKNIEGFLMNEQGFRDYAKSLDPTITPDRQYKLGLDNYNIEVGLIRDLLANNRELRENSIIAVSSKSNDGISGLKDYYGEFENENGSLLGTIKSIYKLSHIIFSNAPSDKEYFLGKKTSVDEVVNHTGSLKPCIIGCDAHKEEELFSKFTWIKADLNFEGMRQICLEPEYRVKIQHEKPDFKEDKLLIDKVKFISPNNVFSNNPIFFNPNLNVIIGGKSSGKSILLYAIAKTLSSDTVVLKNDDDSYKYDLNKIESGLDFEITTHGGFSQCISRGSEENSILPQIKYIPQNYLVKLAEPDLNKKGKSLNTLVRDLITEDDTSKELYQNFVNTVTNNDRLRNTQIDLYFETRKEIFDLEEDLKTKSNKSVLEKNIETNAKKVEELNKNSGFTPQQLEEYKILQSRLEDNAQKRQKLNDDLTTIVNFNAEYIQILKGLNQKRDLFLESLQVQEIKDFYQGAYSIISESLLKAQEIDTSLLVEVRDNGRFFKNDNKIKDVLNPINIERNSINNALKPYLQDEQLKKTIEELNISISNDKKALLDIVNLNKKLLDKKKQLENYKTEIFRIYESSFCEYNNVITGLKGRTVELEKDNLQIVGKTQFNYPKLRRLLLEVSDGRISSYRDYVILEDNKKATTEVDFQVIINESKKLFDEIISKKYALNSRVSISNTIKIALDDYFFDFWEITYKNDKLGEMSTGKASFVILMLIIGLSKSKAPILIDQPEDNLDNRSITTDLVNYLKNKKLERQIIIVTHNANIVVNADAENVIVANQKGQNEEFSSSLFRFDYINGAIENSFDKITNETDILKSMGIRQHIADIVEGGKEAFIMREKKYRFH